MPRPGNGPSLAYLFRFTVMTDKWARKKEAVPCGRVAVGTDGRWAGRAWEIGRDRSIPPGVHGACPSEMINYRLGVLLAIGPVP